MSSRNARLTPDEARTSARLRWVAAVLVLVACTPHADLDATASTRSSATADTPELPAAVLPDGTEITLDVATTPEELARGLMFRPFLPEDRGMLLLFEEQRIPSIWMKNTLVHLDLVFLDNSGRVTDVIERAMPCAADPCPHYIPRNPARSVLEIAAGVAARHGLEAGDIVAFRGVEGYPVEPAAQGAWAD